MTRHLHVYLHRTYDAFVSSEHPRGQPKNKGEFVKKGAGQSTTKAPAQPAPRPRGQTTKAEAGTAEHSASVKASDTRISHAVETYNNSKKTPADQKKALTEIGSSVFEHMHIDKSVGFKIDEPYNFSVGNKNFTTGGWFRPEDNTVTICTNVNPANPQVAGLISHEAMHSKFDAVKKAYDEEDERIFNDEVVGGKDILKPEGGIRPEYQAEFPIHTIMTNGFGGNVTNLRKDDGITDYSRAYWQSVEEGDGDILRAVDETLAEMARLDREGSLPNLLWYKRSKSYKPLYNAIHKLYPAAVKALAKKK